VSEQLLHRDGLISILRGAYSGELAAAYAYRGHWKSVSNPAERLRIQQIEEDEWIHRRRVGEMLDFLQASPSTIREARMWLTGRTIGILCHVIGWFLAMYFAGRLEARNVRDYDTAATHALALGLIEFNEDLRVMAQVEKAHEVFFGSVIATHRLLPLTRTFFNWGPPLPGSTDRAEAPVTVTESYRHPFGEGE
jgi:demethoxyubiquinone hydroxylase (CLK1/Coq7/Cat5 family)